MSDLYHGEYPVDMTPAEAAQYAPAPRPTCATCRHFRPARFGLSYVTLYGEIPLSERKTTGCFLMPTVVEKRANDGCGQHAAQGTPCLTTLAEIERLAV